MAAVEEKKKRKKKREENEEAITSNNCNIVRCLFVIIVTNFVLIVTSK